MASIEAKSNAPQATAPVGSIGAA